MYNAVETLLKALNAVVMGANHYRVKGKNWEIDVYRDPVYNDKVWDWMVGTQVFSVDEHAREYLAELVQEKETGVRIVYEDTLYSPLICGNRTFCRTESRGWAVFSVSCLHCPKAHEYNAKKDGVKLEIINRGLPQNA